MRNILDAFEISRARLASVSSSSSAITSEKADSGAAVFDDDVVVSTREMRGRIARAEHALGQPEFHERQTTALMVDPSSTWLAIFLAALRLGKTVVPVGLTLPEAELAHVLDEARCDLVVVGRSHHEKIAGLAAARGLPVRLAHDLMSPGAPPIPSEPPESPTTTAPDFPAARPALIMFTSGTTGRPKAAVTSRGALAAQVDVLVRTWGWTAKDRALSFLPHHHTHGIVNVTLSAVAAGASVRYLKDATPARIWTHIERDDATVLMAVPTIWKRLLDDFDARANDAQEALAAHARALRLVVSGSAALDPQLFDRIGAVFGQPPLERYGMTEIGMALTNPLVGHRGRGTVGGPFLGVDTAIRTDDDAVHEGDAVCDIEGELLIKSPWMFSGYLGRQDATAASFTDDGWFRTGDVVRVTDGVFKILGRMSADILKTGGEKISALEIEEVMLAHPAVAGVAVVGLPDPDWGQRVVAVVEKRDGIDTDADLLRAHCKTRLAPFKVPRAVHFVDALPRNALGKIMKSIVVKNLTAIPSRP